MVRVLSLSHRRLPRLISNPRSYRLSSTYAVVHPGTGVHVHDVEAATPDEVDQKVQKAYSTFVSDTWPREEARNVMREAARLIRDRSTGWGDRLVASNKAETSIPDWWAHAQVAMVPDFLDQLSASAAEALAPQSYGDTLVEREPFGVCLAMAAWNAPHLLTSRAVCTPLLAGNAVVCKTSEQTPKTQELWAELLYESGLPQGYLQTIHVAPENAPKCTEQLVSDPRIRHVNFTGSTRVGSIIASLAGKHLKPTLMELGGKAPVIILPGANLPIAATHSGFSMQPRLLTPVLSGAFANAGQICMSTERILVPASQHDALVSALQDAWANVKNKQSRALFSIASKERYRKLIEDATSKGARPLWSTESEGGVYPLILTGGADYKLLREESFGPVAVIIKVPDGKDVDQLIDTLVSTANDSEFGLAAAVWSDDLDLATKVARRIEAGAVHVNSTVSCCPRSKLNL